MDVHYTEDASDQLAQLPRSAQVRIKTKIDHYASQKDPLKFAKHLTGHDAYRFRIGSYRVIFVIEGKTIYVLVIAKRDEAYKDI